MILHNNKNCPWSQLQTETTSLVQRKRVRILRNFAIELRFLREKFEMQFEIRDRILDFVFIMRLLQDDIDLKFV